MISNRTAGLALLLAAALGAAGCSRCDDTWDGFAKPFFSAKCVKCHGAMADAPRIVKDRQLILSLLAAGRMPPTHGKQPGLPPAEPVSPEELARITRWLQCGAPGAAR
jgi:hypothetical protein